MFQCELNSGQWFNIISNKIFNVFYFSKNTSITGCSVVTGGEQFLIGTEGGNIYTLDLATFKTVGDPLYQDVIMQK